MLENVIMFYTNFMQRSCKQKRDKTKTNAFMCSTFYSNYAYIL